MVATNYPHRRIALTLVAVGILSTSGCGVPNERTSYGALGCGPTDEELNKFYGPLPNQTQSAAVGLTTCASCHANTVGNVERSGFKFSEPPNVTTPVNASTPAEERNLKANHFCYTYFWGNRILGFAPLAAHPGNSYAVGAPYEGLAAWINQLPPR
ncbi:MAG: hypothetical protein K2X47_10785 [Bdellovibrionales bacterium]|nr:hypothetical protein [Bdellovibrionales bacterium]